MESEDKKNENMSVPSHFKRYTIQDKKIVVQQPKRTLQVSRESYNVAQLYYLGIATSLEGLSSWVGCVDDMPSSILGCGYTWACLTSCWEAFRPTNRIFHCRARSSPRDVSDLFDLTHFDNDANFSALERSLDAFRRISLTICYPLWDESIYVFIICRILAPFLEGRDVTVWLRRDRDDFVGKSRLGLSDFQCVPRSRLRLAASHNTWESSVRYAD